MLERLLLRRVPTLSVLRRWNLWLGVLYVLQAIAVLVVGSAQLVPLTSSFLTIDSLQSTTTGRLVLAPATHHILDLNLLAVVFVALVILAAVYLSAATWYRPRYETELGRNQNLLRWVGYGATATIFFVVLAVLAGVYDITTLLVLLLLGGLLFALCFWTERTASLRGRTKPGLWFGYCLVWLCGAAMWLVVFLYLLGDNAYGAGHVPSRVYWLAVTMALTGGCFALGLLNQLLKPKMGARYRLTDLRYTLLTLLASSLLAWQIVAGTMH